MLLLLENCNSLSVKLFNRHGQIQGTPEYPLAPYILFGSPIMEFQWKIIYNQFEMSNWNIDSLKVSPNFFMNFVKYTYRKKVKLNVVSTMKCYALFCISLMSKNIKPQIISYEAHTLIYYRDYTIKSSVEWVNKWIFH